MTALDTRPATIGRRFVLGLFVAGLLGPGPVTAEMSTIQPDGPFRFEIAQGGNPHRGLAVEGYVYSGLPWRITNVRLRVDSIDYNGAVSAESYGWVLGDVAPGGRAYFYLPISSPAPTYRPAVQSYDRVSGETQTQAP